ncbi:hypothetical protein [Clostridium sp.]|jgi:hypothetical protein|uniref:hypothetical protein n=1 Tax=Clostridium sp. TaxID=1506 RepID=UPI003EE94114
MNILGVITDLLGIGKSALNNRAKLKSLKIENKFKIEEATTNAQVRRINSETEGDLAIDLITNRDKKNTKKDEAVVYLFLAPLFVVTVVPFIVAYKTGEWEKLNILFSESYQSLSNLPEWYFWGLGFVLIDVLGFRSFARKLMDKYPGKMNVKNLFSKKK